jgi:hypothetical protein
METKIVFDLDGTLYNLYGNDYMNAIERIEREEVGMFSKEEMLMVERKSFDTIINKLLGIGVKFAVSTWLPKNVSNDYLKICYQEKMAWIKKNLPFISEIAIVNFGTPKFSTIERTDEMWLFDDNNNVCQQFKEDGGGTFQRNGKIVSKVSAVQVNFRGKRNVVYHLEQIYKAKTGFKGFI